MARQARNVGVRVATPEEEANARAGESWGLPVAQTGAMHQLPASIDDEEIEETAADRVARMLSSSGDDDTARVSLYRMIGPRKYGWCDDYSPAEFEAGGLGMVRKKWGVGEFEIRLYAKRPGTNLFAIRAREMVTLVESQDVTTGAVPAQVPNELARVLETMAAQQAALLQALTARPAAPDPMTQMRDMLGLMTSMRGAMGLDVQAPKSGVSEALAIVRELREASSELNPPDDADNPVGALTRMLPSVLDMVKTGMAQQGAQVPQFPVVELPPALSAAPVSSPVTLHSQPEQQQPENDPMNATLLRMHLAALLDMAEKKVSPANAAETVFAEAPEEVLDMLAYAGWLDLLGKFEPKVLLHRDWFTSVAAIVAEIIKEEFDRTDDEGPETAPAVHHLEAGAKT